MFIPSGSCFLRKIGWYLRSFCLCLFECAMCHHFIKKLSQKPARKSQIFQKEFSHIIHLNKIQDTDKIPRGFFKELFNGIMTKILYVSDSDKLHHWIPTKLFYGVPTDFLLKEFINEISNEFLNRIPKHVGSDRTEFHHKWNPFDFTL